MNTITYLHFCPCLREKRYRYLYKIRVMKLSTFVFLTIAFCFVSQAISAQDLAPDQTSTPNSIRVKNVLELQMIPNPIKHVSALTIDLNKITASMQVQIRSLHGQLIKSIQVENIQKFQTKLSIQHGWFSEPGIYVATIRTPERNKMIRFLVTD